MPTPPEKPQSKPQGFFFEEDPDSTESGVDWSEQSAFFNSVIQTEGKHKAKEGSEMPSMVPMGIQSEASLKRLQNGWIAVEFGKVRKDYAIHTIPINPRVDFGNKDVFAQTCRITILLLNEIVPFDLQVNVFPPDPNWSVKAVSYKIIGGVDAWNLDLDKLEAEVMPKILEQLTQYCMAKNTQRGPQPGPRR